MRIIRELRLYTGCQVAHRLFHGIADQGAGANADEPQSLYHGLGPS